MDRVIILDILLAMIIFAGAFYLGRLLLQYKNDYRPIANLFEAENSVGYNAIIRICIAPVGIVAASILFYTLEWDEAVKHIWIVSFLYFLLQGLLFTMHRQWTLVNKSKFFVFHAVSIAISFYIYQALISKGLDHLLPDEANLRTDLWLLIAGFLYGIFRAIPENDTKFQSRKKHYVKKRGASFRKKYASTLQKYDDLLQDILVAIMIYEDYNRPWTARVIENMSGAKTRGVMQAAGAKTDVQSIKMAAKLLEPQYQLILETAENSSERMSALYGLFRSYNAGDPSYSSEVMTIFLALRSEDYTSYMTPATVTQYQPLQ